MRELLGIGSQGSLMLANCPIGVLVIAIALRLLMNDAQLFDKLHAFLLPSTEDAAAT